VAFQIRSGQAKIRSHTKGKARRHFSRNRIRARIGNKILSRHTSVAFSATIEESVSLQHTPTASDPDQHRIHFRFAGTEFHTCAKANTENYRALTIAAIVLPRFGERNCAKRETGGNISLVYRARQSAFRSRSWS
jgi:hypothetical protein